MHHSCDAIEGTCSNNPRTLLEMVLRDISMYLCYGSKLFGTPVNACMLDASAQMPMQQNSLQLIKVSAVLNNVNAHTLAVSLLCTTA